jgi:C-terminal processing protease CtpA/Prc
MRPAVCIAIAAVSLAAALQGASARAAAKPGACPTPAPAEPLAPARFEDGPTIAAPDLVSDFDGWIAGIEALNPDTTLRADAQVLKRRAAEIRRSLTGPMSQREAWARFALLNPVLGDGHDGIYPPDYRGALAAHLAKGGRIVPVEPRFAPDGSLRVYAVAAHAQGLSAGDRIEAINGVAAGAIAREMLRRAPGDSLGQRRAWTARRFAALYRALYGDTGNYDLLVQSHGRRCTVRLAGATEVPLALQTQPRPQDLFAWRVLDGGIGYLRVDSFDPELRQALAETAKAAFAQFARDHVRALVIDVRENGGGDDPLWQQSLMEFITTKPYAHVSSYAIRVTRENADPGDVVGTVQRARFSKRFTPTPANPLRFSGPVYILAGPFSYSATIQFLVAAQDYGIARIAGQETAALACQTGQVRRIPMPKTGLAAFTPIAAFVRPSGAGCRRGVLPDVAVPIDEVQPDLTLQALLQRIRP